MEKSARAYERLSRRSFGSSGIATLWLGDGHLLQVGSALAIERYRRWYLREVQALVVRRTRKRMLWNFVWGILGGLALAASGGFLGLATASANERQAQIVLQVFAGIAGAFGTLGVVLMLWNSLLGATCTIFVQTADGLAPLAAPTRRRAADALLARLRPVIEEAQMEIRNPKSE